MLVRGEMGLVVAVVVVVMVVRDRVALVVVNEIILAVEGVEWRRKPGGSRRGNIVGVFWL